MKDKILRTPTAAKKRFHENNGDLSVIPAGPYCYDSNGPCPYWASDSTKREQETGYCAKLKTGDWEEGGTMLLWDQVKECDVNPD